MYKLYLFSILRMKCVKVNGKNSGISSLFIAFIHCVISLSNPNLINILCQWMGQIISLAVGRSSC